MQNFGRRYFNRKSPFDRDENRRLVWEKLSKLSDDISELELKLASLEQVLGYVYDEDKWEHFKIEKKEGTKK